MKWLNDILWSMQVALLLVGVAVLLLTENWEFYIASVVLAIYLKLLEKDR